MVQVYENALSQDQVHQLVSYFRTEDDILDRRPDVVSKCPPPYADSWPSDVVTDVLDRVLADAYVIEENLIHESWSRYNLHTDSGRGADQQALYKVVILVLEIDPDEPGGTVFFRNHFSGPSSRFTRAVYKPYQYRLRDRHGELTVVEDIRKLLELATAGDQQILDRFEVDESFIKQLQYLIEVRDDDQNAALRPHIAPRHQWVSDYVSVSGCVDSDFPEDIRQQYCAHIPQSDVQGLVFDQFVPWRVGQAIVFDRTQIHCAASSTKAKLGLTVFTNRA